MIKRYRWILAFFSMLASSPFCWAGRGETVIDAGYDEIGFRVQVQKNGTTLKGKKVEFSITLTDPFGNVGTVRGSSELTAKGTGFDQPTTASGFDYLAMIIPAKSMVISVRLKMDERTINGRIVHRNYFPACDLPSDYAESCGGILAIRAEFDFDQPEPKDPGSLLPW